MAFKRFQFTKLWTNPLDFPTVELEETQVRADMQELHDQAKDGLNELMGELEKPSAAASLGAYSPEGEASNVQAELAELNSEKHTHKNKGLLDQITQAFTTELKASYDAIVTMLHGFTITQTLGDERDKIPTSAAVANAIALTGNLPPGGTAGQFLAKRSGANYDFGWAEVTPAGIGAAVTSKSVDVTLVASSWSGTNPSTLTVTVPDLGAAQNGTIGVAKGATQAQRKAAAAAQIGIQSQAAGSLTLVADGAKPSINIPATVILLG